MMAITELLGIVLRAWLLAAMGGLIAKGWISPEDAQSIVTAVAAAVGVLVLTVWSILRNRLTAILGRAAASPEVKEIVADPEIANAVPSAKVVPADPVRDLP